MPVTAIDHIQLAMPVGGEEAARRFFGDILGMPELPKPAALQARGGLWFQCGVLQLHLGVDKEFQPALNAHPGLIVDKLAPMLAELKAGGFPVQEDAPIPGFIRIYTADPFGNLIELREIVPR
ncbi:glyoxalase [Herbaspirillum rhizosphaerae]|uniref:glyoxalase n=1 Tax=Herbaspirillum rhizosphaerae TaxID=346179 RepID=UPI00067E3328|nr:glyoxalase [Herbaspirillum rhizosphaerae]